MERNKNKNKNNPIPSTPGEQGGNFSIPATPAGTRGERSAYSVDSRRAMFLKSVAGDCPCPRCCGLRDIANTVMNPGTEY